MRVTLITSKLNFVTAGGSVLDVHLKAKSLIERGHQVTVVTAFSSANNMPDPLPYAVREENLTSKGWMAQQRKLYALLKKYAPETDVFYIDGNTFLYGGGMYRMLGGAVPVVAFFNIRLSCWSDTQDNDQKRQTFFARCKRRLRWHLEHRIGVPVANRLDAFVYTTPMVEKLYIDFGFQRDRGVVIPDFVDTQKSIDAGGLTHKTVADRHAHADPVTILTSGRMIKEKGFDLVIRALAILPDTKHLRLVMSGDGPEAPGLQALAKELRVDHLIDFPGWVQRRRLVEFFQRAHVFILPKWWIEYTSVLLIEAMAYGLPAIVPSGGGAAWLAGESAVTFADGNIRELADAMAAICEYADRRIAMAEHALSRAGSLDYAILGGTLDALMESCRQKNLLRNRD